MVISYYSLKKRQQILYSPETDMIIIFKDLRLLDQRLYLLEHIFQMTAFAPQTHFNAYVNKNIKKKIYIYIYIYSKTSLLDHLNK